MDKQLLDFSKLTADQFIQAVKSKSDQDIVHWLRKSAAPCSLADLEKWNEMMLARGPDSEEKLASFIKIRDRIDPTRTDITRWADLLDLEEQRTIPIRKSFIS